MEDKGIDNDEAIAIVSEDNGYLTEDFNFSKKLSDAYLFESDSDELKAFEALSKDFNIKYKKRIVSCASWDMDS